MLTPEEIYTKLNLKVNKNDTNGNVKIPKSVFVIAFNEQKLKYLDQELRENESEDTIENFDDILVRDKPLKKLEENKLTADFKAPDDFFQRVSAYSVASKGSCKDNVITNWFVKPKDINVLLQNANQKPSFEYQETLALVNNGKITVYKDGFTVNETYLTYYKNPPDIDVEGYTKLDGTASTTVPNILNDLNVNKILDRVVVELTNNYQNVEQYQLAVQRQQQNEQRK